MSDTDQALRRCQAYSATLTRYVLTLIEMIDNGKAPPNNATLREALASSVRSAEAKAREVT